MHVLINVVICIILYLLCGIVFMIGYYIYDCRTRGIDMRKMESVDNFINPDEYDESNLHYILIWPMVLIIEIGYLIYLLIKKTIRAILLLFANKF